MPPRTGFGILMTEESARAMNNPTIPDTSRGSLPLAPEAPVDLILDGRPFALLMCSPYDLDELAVGHLFSKGLIASKADLLSLSVCPDMRSVHVKTASGLGASIEPEGLVFSGCGAARVESKVKAQVKPAPLPAPTLAQLGIWAAAMFSAAELYRKTGGLHAAALACGSFFVVREDVGRHNAVDKVLGRGFLDGVDFSASVVLTSGRIAADMAAKAVNAGVPILVTRSIPTTEAYAIAVEAGITLVGRIGSRNPIVYTCPERLAPAYGR
ncbi:MAG: formate dehydrogenase accessory sulfurtransferase FdhD [Spirochaetes bacterium]|nr:formate dehydrogenase accessory sulfurtransferase FdhD [Spirochaetota bacterium]